MFDAILNTLTYQLNKRVLDFSFIIYMSIIIIFFSPPLFFMFLFMDFEKCCLRTGTLLSNRAQTWWERSSDYSKANKTTPGESEHLYAELEPKQTSSSRFRISRFQDI